CEHPAKEPHAHLVEICDAPLPLSMEAPYDVDPPVSTKRHPQGLHHLLEQRQETCSAVGMLVGVDVGGQPAHKRVETLELTPELITDGSPITQIELAFVLPPDIPVKAHRKVRQVTAEECRLRRGPSRDHQARARHHTAPVADGDALVDASGGA